MTLEGRGGALTLGAVWVGWPHLPSALPAGPEAWSCDSCQAGSVLSGGLCEPVCTAGRYPLRKVSSVHSSASPPFISRRGLVSSWLH